MAPERWRQKVSHQNRRGRQKNGTAWEEGAERDRLGESKGRRRSGEEIWESND